MLAKTEQKPLSHRTGWSVNWHNFRNCTPILSKVECSLPYDSATPFLGISQQRHVCTHQKTCTKMFKVVLVLIIPNTQHDRRDKLQCVNAMFMQVCMYANSILWRWTTATHNSIYKSHKQDVSFKKPRHMSKYSMIPWTQVQKQEKQVYGSRNQNCGYLCGGSNWEGHKRETSGVRVMFFFLEGVCSFCNNSLSCTFMICILFVNLTLHCQVYLKTGG